MFYLPPQNDKDRISKGRRLWLAGRQEVVDLVRELMEMLHRVLQGQGLVLCWSKDLWEEGRKEAPQSQVGISNSQRTTWKTTETIRQLRPQLRCLCSQNKTTGGILLKQTPHRGAVTVFVWVWAQRSETCVTFSVAGRSWMCTCRLRSDDKQPRPEVFKSGQNDQNATVRQSSAF